MAGFGTIVTAAFHDAFVGRVLNTHPSLLPDFKGWHAVAQALESGVSQTGCTVHVATEALDDGPILAQRRVEVLADDDESSLHERIKAVERELYPTVVSRVMAALEQGREVSSVAAEMEDE
jgi:phosphoribosylglycinamide formyltransferase-1